MCTHTLIPNPREIDLSIRTETTMISELMRCWNENKCVTISPQANVYLQNIGLVDGNRMSRWVDRCCVTKTAPPKHIELKHKRNRFDSGNIARIPATFWSIMEGMFARLFMLYL